MKLRVIQWATGNVGRAAVEGILAHPDLELVGAYVSDAKKTGATSAKICKTSAPIGVRATTDIDAILAARTPTACSTARCSARWTRWLRLLRAGKNVVTPVGWFYPFRSPGRGDRLQRACAEGHNHAARYRHASRRLHRTLSPDAVRGCACTGCGTCAPRSSPTSATTGPPSSSSREIMLFGKRPDGGGREPDRSIFSATASASRSTWSQPGSACRISTRRSAPSARPGRGRDGATSTYAGRHDPARPRSRRSASRGRAPSAASPSITARVNWLMGDADISSPAWRLRCPRASASRSRSTGDPPLTATFHGHPSRAEVEAGPRAATPGIVGDGAPLRERDPVGVPRGAGHQDVPRPAALRWQGGAGTGRPAA